MIPEAAKLFPSEIDASVPLSHKMDDSCPECDQAIANAATEKAVAYIRTAEVNPWRANYWRELEARKSCDIIIVELKKRIEAGGG